MMKKLLILLVTGAVIASVSFLVYKFISLLLEKERKIAEELLRKDNGQELLHERIKHNKKRMIIMAIFFYFFLGLAVFMAVWGRRALF